MVSASAVEELHAKLAAEQTKSAALEATMAKAEIKLVAAEARAEEAEANSARALVELEDAEARAEEAEAKWVAEREKLAAAQAEIAMLRRQQVDAQPGPTVADLPRRQDDMPYQGCSNPLGVPRHLGAAPLARRLWHFSFPSEHTRYTSKRHAMVLVRMITSESLSSSKFAVHCR